MISSSASASSIRRTSRGRAWYGNTITITVFSYVAGMRVSDTQSGLRGIPFKFMTELIDCKGERFEYEMQMLLECAGRYNLTEVPIKTVYESKENHQTHFRPIKDSVRIYKILGKKFIKFIFASLSSFVTSPIILLFHLFGIASQGLICCVLCNDRNGRRESYLCDL